MGALLTFMSGKWCADLLGVDHATFFLNYDDADECNIYRTCVSAKGPEVRTLYEFGFIPSMAINWTIAYIIYIIGGFCYKKVYMPFWPLCLNITWEFLFGFIFVERQTYHYGSISALAFWFLLDCCLVAIFIKYGQKQLPIQIRKRSKIVQIGYLVVCLIICFLFVFSTAVQLKDYIGNGIAFFQNLIMSLIFLLEFLNMENYDNIDWVDFLGAMGRLTGSFPVSVYQALIYNSSKDEVWGKSGCLMFYILIMMTLFDIVYTFSIFCIVSKRYSKVVGGWIAKYVKRGRMLEKEGTGV